MRSESSMPTASSCDAIRFLRGMFHRMSPLVETINEHCQGWSIWIPMNRADLRKDQNWKKSRCHDQIHRFRSQTAARFLEHIAAKLLASQTRPTPDLFSEQPTHDYFANIWKYMSQSHVIQTDNSQQCLSHMSTGTALSSTVIKTGPKPGQKTGTVQLLIIWQCSPTIKHGTWSPATSIQRMRDTVH